MRTYKNCGIPDYVLDGFFVVQGSGQDNANDGYTAEANGSHANSQQQGHVSPQQHQQPGNNADRGFNQSASLQPQWGQNSASTFHVEKERH